MFFFSLKQRFLYTKKQIYVIIKWDICWEWIILKNRIFNNKTMKILIVTFLLIINIKDVKAFSFSIGTETRGFSNYDVIWNSFKGEGTNAKAKSYTQSTTSNATTELLRANEEIRNNDGFVVCAYECSGNNAGTDGGNCGFEGSNFSGIFYNAEKTNKWRIETNIFLNPSFVFLTGTGFYAVKDPLADTTVTDFTWKHLGNIIPSGGIYYGAPSGDEEENWLETDAYSKLKTSFECPLNMYYNADVNMSFGEITDLDHLPDFMSGWKDSDFTNAMVDSAATLIQDYDDMEMVLCYDNETNECKKRTHTKPRVDSVTIPNLQGYLLGPLGLIHIRIPTGFEIKTVPNYKSANRLSYSLTEELYALLNATNTDMNSLDSNKIFENRTDTCALLKKKKYDKLISTDTYEEILNEMLANRINQINSSSPNRNLYETKHLITLLVPGKTTDKSLNLTYNGESLTEKYKKLEETYKSKFFEAMNTSADKCDVDTRSLDKTEISRIMDNKFENIVLDYGKLDYSELNCDNLFADMADIIRYAYFILEIIAILIIIIKTGLDYSKVFLNDDKDQLKKANTNLMKRIIVLVVLLLLPAIVNLFLKLFKIEGFNSENPLCIEIKQK